MHVIQTLRIFRVFIAFSILLFFRSFICSFIHSTAKHLWELAACQALGMLDGKAALPEMLL